MGAKTKEVGGGPATGLADQFVQWLSQGLNTGTFGAGTPAGTDAVGATGGISAYLNDVLSGGAGRLGGALQQQITTQADRDAATLRARFGAGGGTAFGTGAQFAEGVLRSETAPKIATAVGGLQQNALQMLLPVFASIAGKGITQRQTVAQENPWMTAAKLGLQGGALVAGAMTGNPAIAASGLAAGSQMAAPAQASILSKIYSGGFGQDWQLPQVPLPNWI